MEKRLLFLFILVLFSGGAGCASPPVVAITDNDYRYTEQVGQIPVEVVRQINHKYPMGFWKNSEGYSPFKEKENASSSTVTEE